MYLSKLEIDGATRIPAEFAAWKQAEAYAIEMVEKHGNEPSMDAVVSAAITRANALGDLAYDLFHDIEENQYGRGAIKRKD